MVDQQSENVLIQFFWIKSEKIQLGDLDWVLVVNL